MSENKNSYPKPKLVPVPSTNGLYTNRRQGDRSHGVLPGTG